jgi:hypothetical protein
MILLRIAGRLIMVSIGLFLAGFAAATTILYGLRQLYEMPMPVDGMPGDLAINAVLLALATLVAISHFSLGLIAGVVLLTEILRLRSWLVYAATGALSAVIAVVSIEGRETQGAPMADSDMLLFIAGGLVGGLVYWLIAGRRAGAVMPREEGPPPPKRDSAAVNWE